MRIAYKDITQEFAVLMQEAVQNKDKVSCIQVTRAELHALLNHLDGKRFFPDYWGPREARLRQLSTEYNALSQKLERVTTQVERQQIFDAKSAIEREQAEIVEEVPDKITQNGITIKVVMKA